MGAKASQITSLASVYSTVYSGPDQTKHQSSASLAFMRGIHRPPVNSPHKGPVTRIFFSIWWRHHVPYNDVTSRWPRGAMHQHRSGFTLAQVIIWYLKQCWQLVPTLILSIMGLKIIHCGAIITRSISPKSSKMTPHISPVITGEIWGIFCWFKLWFIFCPRHFSDVCNILLNWTVS